jgi:hypothetical protein
MSVRLRHLGKSPRQAAFFFRSPELRLHAANLASLFLLYGLLRATSKGVKLRRRSCGSYSFPVMYPEMS